MSKLSEVLGGITKDLVLLQFTSDQATNDILSNYKEEFQYLDIPHFSVSDIKLTLKFAVTKGENLEQTNSSLMYAENEWADILKKRVFAKFSESANILSDRDKKKLHVELDKIVNEIPLPDLGIKDALSGNTNTALSKSINYATIIYNKLPQELRNALINETEFRKIISSSVDATLKEKLPSIKRKAISKVALERDLEIIIEKDALDKISESNIHEITINLTPDFIKIIQNEESKE